jgi:hypothetical protein
MVAAVAQPSVVEMANSQWQPEINGLLARDMMDRTRQILKEGVIEDRKSTFLAL